MIFASRCSKYVASSPSERWPNPATQPDNTLPRAPARPERGSLSPLGIRHADHGRIGHSFVAGEHLLQVGGVDVLPTGVDDVLGSPDHLQKAVFVHSPEVAGAVEGPPGGIPPSQLLCQIIPAKVARHHAHRATHDFPTCPVGRTRSCASRMRRSTLGAGDGAERRWRATGC